MDTLQQLVESLSSKPGIAKSWKDETGALQKESFADYHQKIAELSQGFLQLGVQKGDHVMYIADNNPDWIALSLALNNIGAVDVPRGSDFLIDELDYIMHHSDAKFLVVKDERTYTAINDRIPKAIKEVITLDDSLGIPITQIRASGKNSSLALPTVNGDDLTGIIYTSGTTGRPKGVMLSHQNVIANFTTVSEVQGMRADDLWMSGLPPWHIFQRAAEYCALDTGAEMYHTKIAKIAQDLVEIRPTILPSVPLVWEKIYGKGMKKLQATAEEMKGLQGMLFQLLVPRAIPGFIIPAAMKKAIQESLGGRLRLAVSGGGALAFHVDDFFIKAGVPIAEGYGLTETSPVVAARIIGEGRKARGTVGYVLPNLKVRIVDPDTNEPVFRKTYGEVQVSGPSVMKGYYKDPEATKAALITDDEGRTYLKTGDRGKFDKHGHLKLNGRYKETIIGANGENIDPTSLEGMLKKSSFVENTMVFQPEGSKFLFALIVPNQASIEDYCKEKGIAYQDLKSVLQHPEVKDVYDKLLTSYNTSVKPHQKIVGASVLDSAFKVGHEITTTLKLKRKEILENRWYEVDKLLNDKKLG